MESQQNVFLYFFATWCVFCKAFDPLFEHLFSHYEFDDDILITKMDGTMNDVVGGFELNAFPTLYFLQAGDKGNPMEYNGERKLRDILSFIEEFRVHRVEIDRNNSSSAVFSSVSYEGDEEIAPLI